MAKQMFHAKKGVANFFWQFFSFLAKKNFGKKKGRRGVQVGVHHTTLCHIVCDL